MKFWIKKIWYAVKPTARDMYWGMVAALLFWFLCIVTAAVSRGFVEFACWLIVGDCH